MNAEPPTTRFQMEHQPRRPGYARRYSMEPTGDFDLGAKQPSIGEVFTPRSPDVNQKTYVNRPTLEDALGVGLRSSLHLVISGQSGSGKTWLYRYALEKSGVHFEVINLASVSANSFQVAFQHFEARAKQTRKTQYKEKKQVRGNAIVAHGQIETESTFETLEQCHFFRCLKQIKASSKKGKHCCVVFDNLESIVDDPSQMKELADYLILLDDPEYSQFGVQVVLVGVPDGIRDYFRNVANMESVANRLRELPTVSRLSSSQVAELVGRGFRELGIQLGSDSEGQQKILTHISFVTDGLPQRVHEYCFELAEIAKRSGVVSVSDLLTADRRWLKSSLMQAYETVVGSMNRRNRPNGKRNQVLLALGNIDTDEFETQDVNEAVVAAFYGQAHGALPFNSSGPLRELTSQKNPILIRGDRGHTFRFADPRYRMAIRACLRKEPPLDVIALDADVV